MAISKSTITGTQSSGLLFLLPIGLIVVSLLAIIFVVPGSYAQVLDRYARYQEERERRQTLENKLTVLQTASPALLALSPQTVIVMPEKNPVLPFISQLKELSLAENVSITNIKSSSTVDFQESVKRLEFSVTLAAENFQQIVNVLNSLSTRAPLSTIDEVDLRDLQTSKEAQVKLSVYWSKLPESLPPITDPFPAFTPEETALLDQVSKFTPPTFSELNPETGAPRENPFN